MDRAVPLRIARKIRRIIASALVFVLIFPFPFVASAQEMLPEPTEPIESQAPSPEIEEPVTEEAPSESAEQPQGGESQPIDEPTVEEEILESEEPEALMASLAAGESSNSSKTSIDPKFYTEPDPVTGSLVYKYPIIIPPGRNGISPGLSLRYTSQQGEDANTMGYGWNVEIPYVERVNKIGTDNLYSQAYFSSSIDGELASTSAGSDTYGAKIENGDFNFYQFSGGTSWVMIDKKGTTYTFGTSTVARLDNPNNSAQIYRWLLQEVRDTNGNFVSYQYVKDRGQIYPYKITYTNSTTTTARFEVEFVTDARSDVATSSTPGFSIASAKRISEIQAKIDDSWVRRYVLTYGTGDNGTRSMLTSIVESGKDESGSTVTLPATSLHYRHVDKGWTDSGITVPIIFSEKTNLVDVNGDSLVDIVVSEKDGGGITRNTYINNGAGWTASSTWQAPIIFFDTTPSGTTNSDRGVRFGDVNGDGLTDLIQSFSATTTIKNIHLNNGSGWMATTTWAPPIIFGTATSSPAAVRMFDMNGDGLTDISDDGMGYLNNGNGWTASTTWAAPINFLRPSQIIDVNGDGLQDVIDSHNGGSYGVENEVYINDGTGWALDPSLVPPIYFTDTMGNDNGVRMGDVNGDGLTDILQSYPGHGNAVYLNNGHGWTASSTWSIPMDFMVAGTDKQVRLVDANGDGLIDMVQGYDTGPNNKVHLNNSRRTDLLAEVIHPEGGSAEFTYKSAAEYKNGSSLLNPRLPFAINTLSTIALDNGLGTIASTSYSYEGGLYYFSTTTDRRFAGFQKIAKLDTEGNITNSYFHQGNSSNTSTGEYQDDGSKIGKVYRTESYDGSSNLYSKAITKWDKTSLGSNRTFVKLAQSIDFAYDGDSGHKEKA